MASYTDKEISEWNSTDLSNWLLDNKYRGISELCQKYNLSGYDLFFITDDILKNELGLSSFHERVVTLKLISKLTSEHLKLNIINSNGDNVILTLDNNQNTSLGEISEYLGNMFNIEPNYILYKDNTKQEVLSPTLKIINLMILYPRVYKTLNISNMKDYHQPDDKILNNENVNYQRTNTINKTGETIPRMVDNVKNNDNDLMNNNKNEIKNNIPTINNTLYSFGDNNNNTNNRDMSNNINLNNQYSALNNKYDQRYQDISNMKYKSPSELSDINPKNNNILINNNDQLNEGRNTDNMMMNNINNNINPSAMANTRERKYKSEKRIYRDREKDEFYYNLQNGPSDFNQNTGGNKGLGTSSSSEENYNGENEIKYENIDNMRNNYGLSNKNKKFQNFQMNEDINNNYYSKDNYVDNENRVMNPKRGYNDNRSKGKNYNDNFNESNHMSNNYYK
jgi:cation-transporting ATPase 13A3/4/5